MYRLNCQQHCPLRRGRWALSLARWTLGVLWLLARPCQADDGVFWEQAVSETIATTKNMADSRVQLFAGVSAPLGADDDSDMGLWRVDVGGRFLGFGSRPTARLFRLGAWAGLGFSGEGDAGVALDAAHARLSVYTYQKGGMLNIANFQLSRERALDEALVLRFDALDLSVGGAAKAFVFGLSLGLIGYEHRWLRHRADYDGFWLTQLGVDMGFVLFRHARVAAMEISTHGELALSLPVQKDANAGLALAVHFNSFVLPVSLTAFGDFVYTEHAAGDDMHFFHVGGRLSLRY